MKASILIASYLWKDIWRQWFTNPLSVVSRLSIAGFLFGLALALDVYFAGIKNTAEQQLEATGLQRVVINHVAFGSQVHKLDGRIGNRLERLGLSGNYAYLKRLPLRAEVELLGPVDIITYRERDLPDIQNFFGQRDSAGCFVLATSTSIPHGTNLKVAIQNLELDARIKSIAEADLQLIGRSQILLIPDNWIPELDETGFGEIILYESASTAPSLLREEMSRIRKLLDLDGITSANIRSGLTILERLEEIRQQQANWSALVRSIIATLIILVFASTSFLEYRDNAYLSALLQSMGVPRLFLFARYLAEHTLLIFVGFIATSSGINYLLGTSLLQPWDLPHELGELFSVVESFKSWSGVLAVTALLSLIPVLMGLRKEIGRILQ